MRSAPVEVFGVALRLGLTAFGGPIAHLGYFREAFVRRRRWLDEAAYADLVALCQFLPGPASSQSSRALCPAARSRRTRARSMARNRSSRSTSGGRPGKAAD